MEYQHITVDTSKQHGFIIEIKQWLHDDNERDHMPTTLAGINEFKNRLLIQAAQTSDKYKRRLEWDLLRASR